MNIVISGGRAQIYGNEVQTYKTLPVGHYNIGFNQFSGFYLTISNELEVKESKIYGDTIRKVGKCLDSFSHVDRNFGVILSGAKGAGKSLFTRVLARSCIDRELPVIKVNIAVPGIADFISSIDQECCVIFDEFDKVFFSKHDEVGPQSELLSLFDGMDNGKKLFVITCNSLNHLSNYLLERPGRFHYHFTFGSPALEDVAAYLRDKLNPDVYAANIDRLMYYANIVDITYDYLRAICFELNNGYSLDETLDELNIAHDTNADFDFIAHINFEGRDHEFICRNMDLKFRSGSEWDSMRMWCDSCYVRMYIGPEDIHFCNGEMVVDMTNVEFDSHIYDNSRDIAIENFQVTKIEIRKSSYRRLQQRLMI